MVDKAGLHARNWAILIGINFYVNDKSLQGCVRDTETIEQYLRARFPPNDIDILTLTSVRPSNTSPRIPEGKPDQLPTYENVKEGLTRILKSSKPGDLVYVHFSGHGTRIPHTGALALVLFDHVHGSRLLHGQLLASILEIMTGKGLFVTLVLDCCFSGSVLRHGEYENSSVRMTGYNPAIDSAYPFQEFDMNSTCNSSHLRDAYVLPQWLVNPNYTILTACAPHETAKEIETQSKNIHTKERRGALSYFLLETLISLKRSGLEVTNLSLHQHLLMKFHTYWPRQTPMRRGNQNLSFFGKLQFESGLMFVPIFKTADGRTCLDAGYAHDVHKGDEYALYPFDAPETTSNDISIPELRFRVDAVGCLTSDLVTMNTISAAHQIEAGWKARLLTKFPSWSISVRIMAGTNRKAQWITVAKQHPLLYLHTEDEDKRDCLFNVSRNSYNEYEILDTLFEKNIYIPSIPTNQEGAIEQVISILSHLARFKRFEGIENRVPCPDFERSFKISTDCELEATGFYDINHGSEWQFTVENLSDKSLYLTIFNLCPSRQIKNLVSDCDGGLLIIEPKSKLENTLQMEVPEFLRERGHSECFDVMKFFVTGKLLYLPSEVLPNISQSIGNSSRIGGTRGNNDHFSECLSLLEHHLRGAEDDPWNSAWASRNFLIRTVA